MPWKTYDHQPMDSRQPWHEYRHLESQTRDIAEEIRETLEAAVACRDAFLLAACSVLNNVVMDFAREQDIEVHDKFEDGGLRQREFVDPLNMASSDP